MTRNLKALGLALVAVFAFSAMAASVASAAEQGLLTSEKGNAVTLKDIETGGVFANAYVIGPKSEPITCPGSTMTGHKRLTVKQTEEGKTHELLPFDSTVVTITPDYRNCRTVAEGLELFTTVLLNGCDYDFTIGATIPAEGAEGTYSIMASYVCPAGKDIQIKMYSGAGELATLCTATIKPQGPLGGLHATNTPGKEDFDISGAIEGINYTREGAGCPKEESSEGKRDIDATFEGTNSAGEPEGITITD